MPRYFYTYDGSAYYSIDSSATTLTNDAYVATSASIATNNLLADHFKQYLEGKLKQDPPISELLWKEVDSK